MDWLPPRLLACPVRQYLMSKITIILIILLTSCNLTHQQGELKDAALVTHLIEQFILTDSLNQYGFVITELRHYEHYDLKYTDGGIRHPSPGSSYKWKNETSLIEYIDLTEYFDDSISSQHVKSQIMSSKEYAESIDLSSLGEVTLGANFEDTLSWYLFYLPIFNIDSSAVYIQYDHFDNGYEDGNAAVFIKKDDEWVYYKFLLGWIT